MAESHSSQVLPFTIKKSLDFTLKRAHQQAQGASERWGEKIGPWRGSWNFSCRIFYWILLDFVNVSHVSQTGCLGQSPTEKHQQAQTKEAPRKIFSPDSNNRKSFGNTCFILANTNRKTASPPLGVQGSKRGVDLSNNASFSQKQGMLQFPSQMILQDLVDN